MKWRLLEPAKRTKKGKQKKGRDKSAKLSKDIGAKSFKDKFAVDAVSLDEKGEILIKRSNQTIPRKMNKAGGAVYSTATPITIALEDTPIPEPRASEDGASTVELETNKTRIENLNEDGMETNEHATQPGALSSIFDHEEDLDLSFLNSWANDVWFDEITESPIFNTTERVLVHPSSERR